ncbi:twin transmembrane helix small protein [Epibacterium sp. SM1969]|uniref:Twin transmembrane helix small protein n=1 Tax=Tritonibacter aquimaris TaxID=2663379 RepID=A0A844AX26_9RHOB|nr:twin transmembrane helix small protein [Tritonibacter aquimaris]MQY44447.1 twin transmembrane helix small protein [Tritonibacter aquimaris]
MSNSLYIFGILAIGATVLVLVLGIGSFGVGGKFHRNNSNRLMRLRLLFQFIAILAVLGFVYFRNQGGQ